VTYLEHWRALAARIRGLTDAGQLYAQFQTSSTSDSYGAGKLLGEQCGSVLGAVEEFAKTHERTLPPEAKAALGKFLGGHPGKVIRDMDAAREARAALVFLSALETEVSFLLAGRQELVRARSELAFLHLQRLLIVDDDVRTKWKRAHAQGGEPACEKLGAVHLLWHGIYAFKVNAEGARTDLVFNEPLERSFERRGVEGLVLTEWKTANAKNGVERFEEGRTQAKLYKDGPLVASELTGYRYVIAVSLEDLPHGSVPDDLIVDGVVYRHINIAIEPKPPSVRARE
jgi:hypothetical protein